MKQLLTEKDLIGKTVATIVTAHISGEMWIKFTDNSFVVIDADATFRPEVVVVSEWPVPVDSQELLMLGVITATEYSKIKQEQKEKQEQLLREHQERVSKEIEEQELKEYL